MHPIPYQNTDPNRANVSNIELALSLREYNFDSQSSLGYVNGPL